MRPYKSEASSSLYKNIRITEERLVELFRSSVFFYGLVIYFSGIPDSGERELYMCLDNSKGLQWYIFVTNDSKWTESMLLTENVVRRRMDIDVLHFFIPSRHIENKRYSVLRQFVFIYGTEESLTFLLKRINYHTEGKYIWYYKDRKKNNIFVSDNMMQQFISICTEYRQQIELSSDISGIAVHQTVILNSTPFKGEKAQVLHVKHTRNGIQLTLGLQLFLGTIQLRITDIKDGDVKYINTNDKILNTKQFIHQIQIRLLPILSRKVYGKWNSESLRHDMQTLNELSIYFYHEIEDVTAQWQLTSLMLICFHLMHNKEREHMLLELALQALSNQSLRKEQQEVFCWLNGALYISTGNPEYRSAAKKYIQENESSNELRTLVKLIRKKRIK